MDDSLRRGTGVTSDEAGRREAADLANPEILSLVDLRPLTLVRPYDAARLGIERLRDLVKGIADRDLGDVVLELTARHPWAPTGYMDVYHPGRWDCESDQVYLGSIHQTGPSVGEWDGSVVYLKATAPAAGTYIVVVDFSGYQQTMRLSGPWGTATAYNATTSTTSAVTALWTAAAGETLYATMSAKADSGFAGTAYLKAIQIFAPA